MAALRHSGTPWIRTPLLFLTDARSRALTKRPQKHTRQKMGKSDLAAQVYRPALVTGCRRTRESDRWSCRVDRRSQCFGR
jgi:hypothetical protein